MIRAGIIALLLLTQATTEPPPPDHHVFDNEEAGGRAFEAAMYCLAEAVPRSNRPPTRAEIAAVHDKCSAQTARLREELVRIFVAHPSRGPGGLSPGQAADQFVTNLLNRFDYLMSNPARTEK